MRIPSHAPRRRWAVVILAAVLALGSAAPLYGQPAAGTVGTGTPGSCDEAALDAALAGGGAVSFNCGAAPHLIIVTTNKVVTINTTVDGGNLITLSGANRVRLFRVHGGATLTLRNIILTNGGGYDSTALDSAYDAGGALYIGVTEAAVLEHVTVRNSSVPPDRGAGGIYVRGVLTMTDSLVQGNAAPAGGGIYLDLNARAVISSSQILSNTAQGNSGGGIHNQGWLEITGGALSHNRVQGTITFGHGGGALHIHSAGTARLEDVTVSYNESSRDGGGVMNNGALTVISSDLVHNHADSGGGAIESLGATTLVTGSHLTSNSADDAGGGVEVSGGSLTLATTTVAGNTTLGTGGGVQINIGTATITGTTLSGNTANYGAGLLNDNGGNVTLENVTLSGNVGGGLFNNNRGALRNVTISGNTGLGLESVYSLGLSLLNVVLAGNGQNCSQPGDTDDTSAGFNLSSDATCVNLLDQPSDKNSEPALLRPLGDYGGPTHTHVPLPGSPAIDGGLCLGAPATDQRGLGRPAGAACDIGAVEVTAADLILRLFLPLLVR